LGAELLDRVYQTGEPHTGNAVLVRVNAIPEGGIYDRFLNFVYQPSRNLEGTIDGIFVHAVDVTELVLARQRIEESEHRSPPRGKLAANRLDSPIRSPVGLRERTLVRLCRGRRQPHQRSRLEYDSAP
jgi:hypothetical protein